MLLASALYLDGQPPQTGVSGLWFTAGALALVLGGFLSEPFFTTPVDALLTGAALGLTAWETSATGAVIPPDQVALGQLAFGSYALCLVVVSGAAILLKDTTPLAAVASSLAWLSARAGRAVLAFSAVYLAALYAAFADEPARLVAGLAIWLFIVGVRPLEGLASLAHRLRIPGRTATIISLEDPASVVLRLPAGDTLALGSSVSWSGGATGTVVDRTLIHASAVVRLALDAAVQLQIGRRVALRLGARRKDLIGYVGSGTSIGELRIRAVPGAGTELAARRLVYPARSSEHVFYLTTEASTIEDREANSIEQRVEIRARKIGCWSDEAQGFITDAWLPDPGLPVFLHPAEPAPSANTSINPSWIGQLPGTSFGAPITISDAVTHNTAILGILGAGKTTLAHQLIRRMIVAGFHVVVLDISRRYSQQYRDIFSVEAEQLIRQYIEGRKGDRKVISAVLDRFIGGDARLLVLDPADLVAARTNSTPASVTREVAETLLRLAQRDNADLDPETARYCLISEEAHTLIPEWTSVVEEDERRSVNGTARALLQGRKYGLGCVIITQRTANVAKSIVKSVQHGLRDAYVR